MQAVSWLGLGTVVLGEMVRKAAMVSLGQVMAVTVPRG